LDSQLQKIRVKEPENAFFTKDKNPLLHFMQKHIKVYFSDFAGKTPGPWSGTAG